MEFLRFGSSIPGQYWGCCAADIIQNFNSDPDTKASIQLVDGDGGDPVMFYNDSEGRTGAKFAGKTYGEIFRQRLRYGTFSSASMANHAFFCILTAWQIKSGAGKKWLKILKEEGFEFVRAIDNSVYTGSKVTGEGGKSSKPNYLFALFRNIGTGRIEDPFTPPKQWTDLDSVVPEAWEKITEKQRATLSEGQRKAHTELWENLPKDVFYSREQLEQDGVPVFLAGLRSTNPQELASTRERRNETTAAKAKVTTDSKPAPFKTVATATKP